MKKTKLLIFSLLIFVQLVAKIDRISAKASHQFCIHFIDGPPQTNPAWESEAPFPTALLSQPFFYLGKGAQSFVFESKDQEYVIKFYKFPAHLRRFDWMKHPLHYLWGDLSEEAKTLTARNERRFQRTFNSFILAYNHLQQETGVVYIHLNPTPLLQHNLQAFDRSGTPYKIPLGRIGFILQKKGKPFIPLLRTHLQQGQLHDAKQMIQGLLDLIVTRCKKGISDLDNMDHNNYGWRDGRATHLDVGRLVTQEEVKNRDNYIQEVIRVTSPLKDFLEKQSPELLQFYYTSISQL